jgi:hypothetical protein
VRHSIYHSNGLLDICAEIKAREREIILKNKALNSKILPVVGLDFSLVIDEQTSESVETGIRVLFNI